MLIFQICQLHVEAILARARFVISMVSVGKIPHIAAVIGITYFTGEALHNLAWQGFCRDWCVRTGSISSVNAKHASALQPAPCSLTADKVWSAGCQLCFPI